MSFYESEEFKRLSKNIGDQARKELAAEFDKSHRRRKFWDKVLTTLILVVSLTIIHFASKQT